MAFDREKFRQFLTPPKKDVKEQSKKEPMKIVEHSTVSLPIEDTSKEQEFLIPIIEESKKEIEKEVFEVLKDSEHSFSISKLNLSDKELLELKKVAYAGTIDESVSLSELIDLVLLAKTNKEIQTKNKDSLLLKEYIDVSNKITIKGKVLLEEEDTKERLREIL